MPEVNPVGGSSQTSAVARSLLAREDFLKILISELSNQDPFAPMDNQRFMEQLASIQNLEAVSALTDGIRDLGRMQEMASAGSLIGKFVRGVSDSGESVEGIVQRVTVTDDKIRLIVNNQPVAIDSVSEMLYTLLS
ncbi:MAG: flagellar hook capping FlgD N-terminal domain-containing protein [Planctomycetota bacterium]|nr:flagellar hook capping FlgD N-terminal domain-containing protein [Planctomycetota bacterium]